MVFAANLTESAILAGVRSGRVFIKTRGPDGPDIRFTVPELGATMGDVVAVSRAVNVTVRLEVNLGDEQHADLIRNGVVVASQLLRPSPSRRQTILDVPVEVKPGDWVRVSLRDSAGVTVLTTPIYFR